MKLLPILWKRLVNEGETCPRCGSTQRNVMAAIAKLEPALRPLGIQPVLETQTIDDNAFRAAPAESNRIWIAGKPMEEWLEATVGSSRCCSVCGESECRTVEVRGTTFETIPEELFLRAALIASAELVGVARDTRGS